MSVCLYSVTLQRPSALTDAAIGQFAGVSRQQEVILARGSWLEVYRPDSQTGQLHLLLSYNTFSTVRSLATFHVIGSTRDHLIVSSDSGRIAVLEYDGSQNTLKQIHLETYGKTGVRRVVPGEYLAVDPKGRATMIASIEKNKLVYVLNRDSENNITISSPLEAHTPRTLVYTLQGVDVGYDNPLFAAIESDYLDSDDPQAMDVDSGIRKKLTYYELDLGLNHVVRKWTEPIDSTSNVLIQVPGGTDGPSGVLVCSDGLITYKNIDSRVVSVPIPQRESASEVPYIVCAVMHKMRGAFFMLAQSNYGDIYKIWMDHDRGKVSTLYIKYFDTIPLAVYLGIFKSGMFFAGSEAGDHTLYHFEKLGDEDDKMEYSSDNEYKPKELLFTPGPLDNIQPADSLRSLNPLTSTAITSFASDQLPQIFTLTGQRQESSLRQLKYGYPVTEVVATELPAAPIGLWTIPLTKNDDFDKYIVLSFSNETLVLSIGESVEEVTDSLFLLSTATLLVRQLGQDSLLQVHSRGLRHIMSDGQINEWDPPEGVYVTSASANRYQVALILSNSELVYFEVDEQGQQLNEFDERKVIPGSPVCVSVGEIAEGRVRTSFLAIGCANSTVRILSVDLENTLETLSVQALTAKPADISIMLMKGSLGTPSLFLHIGLENGVYIMSILDQVTGELSNTRTRFLGPRPVKLVKGRTSEAENSEDLVLTLTSQSWVGYTRGLSFEMVPLLYEPLSLATRFSSSDCPMGMVGLEGNKLKIFTINKLGEKIHHLDTALLHTPRRIVRNSFSQYFYVLETDNNQAPVNSQVKTEAENPEAPPKEYQPRMGSWASSIAVVDPTSQQVVSRIELQDNEAAFSITTCVFSTGREVLIVGTAKDQQMTPATSSGGYIHVYDYSEDGSSLQLFHKTQLDQAPLALLEFQNRLLVGMGGSLRIYDLGQKQLLRKCEANLKLNNIVTLNTQGDRIIVGDIRQSLTFVVYKEKPNLLIPFADDPVPRHITAAVMLDYDTVAAADRFGNYFVLRCSRNASQASDEEAYGTYLSSQQPFLNGAPYKLELAAHYYGEDMATSMHRASLAVGGPDCIIYGGIQGTIGALIPLTSKQDVEFFSTLETQLRQLDAPITGRDHLVFRGYYAPAKSSIDGDLCERFGSLAPEKQEQVATALDRTVREVERKVAEVRIRSVF